MLDLANAEPVSLEVRRAAAQGIWPNEPVRQMEIDV